MQPKFRAGMEFDPEEAQILLRYGWEQIEQPPESINSECLLRAPESYSGDCLVVTATIPDESELVEMATRLNVAGQEWRGKIYGWDAHYTPAHSHTYRSYMLGAKVDEPEGTIKTHFYPATLQVGHYLWTASVSWANGPGAAPVVQVTSRGAVGNTEGTFPEYAKGGITLEQYGVYVLPTGDRAFFDSVSEAGESSDLPDEVGSLVCIGQDRSTLPGVCIGTDDAVRLCAIRPGDWAGDYIVTSDGSIYEEIFTGQIEVILLNQSDTTAQDQVFIIDNLTVNHPLLYATIDGHTPLFQAKTKVSERATFHVWDLVPTGSLLSMLDEVAL
jgi:hypothetical protein